MTRVGFLGIAHMHSYGYAHGLKSVPDVQSVAVYDRDPEKAAAFGQHTGTPVANSVDELLAQVDAVIVTSENAFHAELGLAAIAAGKPVLCEKPLVTKVSDGEALIAAAESANVPLMTAFPCRYSPAFQNLKQRVQEGQLGAIKAICSTNRGRCPFGWFVETELSGGGAMIDHTVHVTDLLRAMLGQEVVSVFAQTGNQMYQQEWDDTAMLTLEFESGLFATLDSSWSRHPKYKTWGDVTMNVVGEKGVVEMDMFGQAMQVYSDREPNHAEAGYGSNIDAGLVADFFSAVRGEKPVPITGRDGLQAVKVALAGYESQKTGQPVRVS
jgi:predicted dehydrogenase